MGYWLVWKGSGLSRHRSPVFRGAYPAEFLADGLRLGEQGQAERHLGSLAETTYCLDASIVRLDDSLGYGQTESCAPHLPGTRLVKAVEALEDARQLISWYAGTTVLDRDAQLAGAHRRREGDFASGLAVLGSVVHQGERPAVSSGGRASRAPRP